MRPHQFIRGTEVWIHNGEFPVKETVDFYDEKMDRVWLSDGNHHNPKEVYSSERACKKAS